ncbi:MAG: LamG domain-containing protein, partial [Thermodesulfovibrionales bacterium]|nr:LamG domain-containing protein [Thermodesulfovibrionales bacterium]
TSTTPNEAHREYRRFDNSLEFGYYPNGFSSLLSALNGTYLGPFYAGKMFRASSASAFSGWIDRFLIRKYTSPEPTTSVGNETAAGISKAGAYGIGANTTTAYASINDQAISGAIASGWNHIVLTYDKDAGGTDEIRLYVNGVQKATGDYSTAISTNANNLLIGDLIGFNGTIDEVRIYNRALSAAEIKTSYNSGQNTLLTYGDEQPLPTIQFTSTSSSGAESVTPAQLELSLSAAFEADVKVNYAVTGGTATSDVDYTLAATGTAIITAGNTTTTIDAIIIDDDIDESDETIEVTISNPFNAKLGTNTLHTYTILDNDTAGVTITESAGSTDVTEGGATDTYDVVLTSQPAANVSIGL